MLALSFLFLLYASACTGNFCIRYRSIFLVLVEIVQIMASLAEREGVEPSRIVNPYLPSTETSCTGGLVPHHCTQSHKPDEPTSHNPFLNPSHTEPQAPGSDAS